MKINGYFINVVCANYDERTKGYGDIYDELEECLEHHPYDEVIFGFQLKKEGVEQILGAHSPSSAEQVAG